ncbi:MAG: hypothetical protein M3O87_00230, partial [Candidatus Dormibacteraeota bacterium]|nr:hypothetical protein [Candidatus Dormibacteraeota bacterium]
TPSQRVAEATDPAYWNGQRIEIASAGSGPQGGSPGQVAVSSPSDQGNLPNTAGPPAGQAGAFLVVLLGIGGLVALRGWRRRAR